MEVGTFASSGIACEEKFTKNFTYDEESATDILYTDEDDILVPIVMSVIIAFGLLTNLAFFVVVLRVRHMRTTTNHYLIQIALADALYLVFGAGSRVLFYATSPVIFDRSSAGGGAIGCTLIPLFRSASYFAAIVFMALTTREKFLAICRPLKHRVLSRGWRRTARLTVAAWVSTLVVSASLLPATWVYTVYCIVWPASWDPHEISELPEVVADCVTVAEWAAIYYDILQTIPFFGIMFATFIMYYRIIRSLHVRVAAQETRQHGPITAHKIRTRNQVTLMLAVNGAVFFCLLAPFECFSLAAYLRSNVVQHPILTEDQVRFGLQIARVLAYLKSAVSPVIYCVVHPLYRSATVATFCHRWKELSDSSRGNNTNEEETGACCQRAESGPRTSKM